MKTPEHLTLQLCGPHDVKKLVRLSRETYKQHYQYLWQDHGAQYMHQHFNAEALLEQIRDEQCDIYFINKEGEAIGVLKLVYSHGVAQFQPNACVEIQRIYLDKSSMGQGVGTKVMELTEQIALAQGKSVLWLMVMDSSPARLFYQKCGFKKYHQTTLNFPRVIPKFGNMDIMIKVLKS